MIAHLLIAAAQAPAPVAATSDIVVTASRLPLPQADSAASVTLVDQALIDRLGTPLLVDVLRLAPSMSVSSSGPAGTLTQVRIRGAEANHSLLFIDGIKANDLSFGDEPRFEILNADLASRVEIVRGPQSALWGSQAIGGVVAVDGLPGEDEGLSGAVEAGSFGFRRATASASASSDRAQFAGAVGFQRARGIDMFGGGDRDGYRNRSARAAVAIDAAPGIRVGANGFLLDGHSEFDGDDPVTFLRTQALETRLNLAAGRVWAQAGKRGEGLSGTISASLLRVRNRYIFEGTDANSARGTRRTLSGQGEYGASIGATRHRFVVALDSESEDLKARDIIYGGLGDQESDRNRKSLTGEWIADAGPVTADVALRRDWFSQFEDATTLRASLLARLGGGFSLAASYGEGIAPPTFSELYGVFPGSFVGNPDLKPERSTGYELALRYRSARLDGALTVYRQRLTDEITTVFFPDFTSSAVNKNGKSKRGGIEAEAGWRPLPALRVSAQYAYLDAREPQAPGAALFREIRRPRHSAGLAVDGRHGRIDYGGSLAFVGKRSDNDFSTFPARPVSLGSYWLAGARAAIDVGRKAQFFVRGSNLFDADYEDVYGYRTEGRGVFVGLRLADRRSSR